MRGLESWAGYAFATQDHKACGGFVGPLWMAVGRAANVDSCGGRSRVVLDGTCVGGSKVAMEKR